MVPNTLVKVKRLVSLAMLCTLAFAVTYLSKQIPISVAGFLRMDFKDVIIIIGGFIFGPIAAAAVSIVTSFLEMITISATGFYGFFMNVVSSCAFACIAAAFYKKSRTMKASVAGLVAGALSMTVLMILWNYIITPIYMGLPRGDVAAMLIPVFLPFNLLKSGINVALTILLYKPVIVGLRKAGLAPAGTGSKKGGVNWGLMGAAVFLLASLAVLFLVLAKII